MTKLNSPRTAARLPRGDFIGCLLIHWLMSTVFCANVYSLLRSPCHRLTTRCNGQGCVQINKLTTEVFLHFVSIVDTLRGNLFSRISAQNTLLPFLKTL